jgi:hypothetical protein
MARIRSAPEHEARERARRILLLLNCSRRRRGSSSFSAGRGAGQRCPPGRVNAPAAVPTDPVQRQVSPSGGFASPPRSCAQKIALGRQHARKTVTVHVGHDTLVVEPDDGNRTIRRNASEPVFQIKAQRSRKIIDL